MRFVICGSMTFSKEMINTKNTLESFNHEVVIPTNSEKYANGEIALENGSESTQNKIDGNLIQEYFNEIKRADAVIILNYDKNGIKNYVGGNSFLEMGFAHALDKKIYLINDIPDMIYSDELIAMQPVILNNDLNILNK